VLPSTPVLPSRRLAASRLRRRARRLFGHLGHWFVAYASAYVLSPPDLDGRDGEARRFAIPPCDALPIL